MGKICTFCQHKRPENRCSLVVSEASVEYTERCCYYEPVEEVAPVIHAHWYHRPHVWGVDYCSNCDFELHINDTKYCPNCGAKMDEE